MEFDTFLPQSRIEASRGLWPDRLPIDDLDRAVSAHPSRTAFVGVNSARGEEIHLSYAELAARVEEIAGAILYFAGPTSAYTTGQILSVSGGLTMAG